MEPRRRNLAVGLERPRRHLAQRRNARAPLESPGVRVPRPSRGSSTDRRCRPPGSPGRPASTSTPPPVFSMISGNAPRRGCTTGTPQAIASRRNNPFGSSYVLGTLSTSSPRKNSIFPGRSEHAAIPEPTPETRLLHLPFDRRGGSRGAPARDSPPPPARPRNRSPAAASGSSPPARAALFPGPRGRRYPTLYDALRCHRPRPFRRPVSLQVDAQRHHVHLACGISAAAPVIRRELAHRREPVHLPDRADQFHRLRSGTAPATGPERALPPAGCSTPGGPRPRGSAAPARSAANSAA